ncbi:MAG: RimK family alpha-L-glutamate ligase [Cyclobacteriaceae bacterium]
MKKIGVLHGMERSFPQALVENINKLGLKDIKAEPVMVDVVEQGKDSGYAVIIDRISQDVPFYRAFLKNAALCGTTVINNPFWWSADEKFFNNALATQIGVPVPKTVILPSHERPTDTSENSFSNLKFPLSWDDIFEYIGWPAFMKPHAGGGWKNVYKLHNMDEFFNAYRDTGQLVMLLQEEIVFDEYFRCYCIGGKHVRIMPYEPRNPFHLRYHPDRGPAAQKLLKLVEDYVLQLNHALGYDFNTVEFAVRDGIPYAIDFCNPAPDAEVTSVGQENFDWVVDAATKMAVERAQAQKPGADNLTWGTFVQRGFKTAPSKKTASATPKKAAKKSTKK